MPDEDHQQFELAQCDICSRSFQLSSLEKHQNICRKLQSKKRAVFDSKKQRSVPLPDDYQPPKPPVNNSNSNNVFTINGTEYQRWSKPTEKPTRVPSKTRSLDDVIFRDRGRLSQLHKNKKAMIECPHCLRIFQEGSAERHIKFCEEVHSRVPINKDNWDAKSKLAIRTQYQPPPPRPRRTSNESLTPSRRTRRVAPVVEEGLTSNLPTEMFYHRQHTSLVYNNRIDTNTSISPPRKARSKMVTYGAVQPFSGPVISKENMNNRKSRFTDQPDTKKPQRIYITDQEGYQNESRDSGQVIIYPDTISAQIQTDQIDVPGTVYNAPKVSAPASPVQYQPIYMHPLQRTPYLPPYWNPKWQPVNPWFTEDSYLQMAPKLITPMLYQHQWSPYPVLPDLSPRNSSFSNYTPRRALEFYPKESPRQYLPPPDRNLLSRDDTLLDNDYFGSGGSHLKNTHRYCGNCGSKFHSFGAHYCSECGTVNNSR